MSHPWAVVICAARDDPLRFYIQLSASGAKTGYSQIAGQPMNATMHLISAVWKYMKNSKLS
jgi:hypothetical protein